MKLIDVEKLALSLMGEHNLIEQGWSFKFDNAKTRFGCCWFSLKRITISKHLASLNNEKHVTNTILHEIAHALIDPKHGHDKVWRAKAVSIGHSGSRTYSDEVIRPTINRTRFTGKCPKCERIVYRYKRNNISCGRCDKNYNPEYKFIWS
jgi:predicted SprT family Zn-dependent metalloprotease